MTIIKRLNISHIRNIDQLTLEPCEKINLIHGVNGSGKTSILESIHILAVGHSFRSSKTAPVIQNSSKQSTVFAELAGSVSIGLQKSRNQKPLLKLQGAKQPSWLEVARLLPVQVINSDTFRLLEGSPKDRRRFLDWGVFHVEPSFIDHWRNGRKCIAHRNLLLKTGRPERNQLSAWNAELCNEADKVDEARKRYFTEFLPILTDAMRKIGVDSDLSLEYYRGWDKEMALSEVLERGEAADLRYGSTQFGPHRADIIVKQGGISAVEVLSRGQQKMLVSALKLAQGAFQSRSSGRECLFLIDDLPAELDEHNRAKICSFILGLDNQVFITSVDQKSLENCWETTPLLTKFHVEHGKIHH